MKSKLRSDDETVNRLSTFEDRDNIIGNLVLWGVSGGSIVFLSVISGRILTLMISEQSDISILQVSKQRDNGLTITSVGG